ncbi:hypothetical protein [Natronomonas salsuginis]|jgi:hypothetical protein|uniref:hypothetical protein n=1 Tax=Natronomonas salsuginis TaxID=2217661 RepID=UPI001C9E3EAC|nr:hypothetical protein [Natronomonas salsuginis]
MNARAVASSLSANKLRIALIAALIVGVGVSGAFAVGVLGVPESWVSIIRSGT